MKRKSPFCCFYINFDECMFFFENEQTSKQYFICCLFVVCRFPSCFSLPNLFTVVFFSSEFLLLCGI